MNSFIKLAVGAAVLSCNILMAQSPADAEGFVKEAVAFAKSSGKEAFLKEVNGGRFSFKAKKTLYISVYGMDGAVLAHGAKADKVGGNDMTVKDSKGNAHVKARIDLAASAGKGWVDYMETDPVTAAVEPKTSYVEKIDDMVVSCGVYKK